MTSTPVDHKRNEMNYSLPREMAVCCQCVADSELEIIVKANSLPDPCKFCQQTTVARGKLSSVLEAIR